MNATPDSRRIIPMDSLIEPHLTGLCAACGRRMPSWELEGEARHVGGHSVDVVYWYCKAGVGHRAGEVTNANADRQ